MTRHLLVPALFATALLCIGCSRAGQATAVTASAASTHASSTDATAAMNGVIVHASALPTADLNEAVARQYGLTRDAGTLLLLVTVRDANGDAVPADAVKVQARAGVLPDALAPLALRAIETNGLTDYIGTVSAHAPASVQFEVDATRGGAHSKMSFTRDLLPR